MAGAAGAVSRGFIVTFSGVECSGKSTQIERLLSDLEARGLRSRYVWSRGGYTPLFTRLKALVRRGLGSAAPEPGHSERRTRSFQRPVVRKIWLQLAILDLLLLYGILLRWWRWRGDVVVCDRYLVDTAIDFQSSFPEERVARWWTWRLLRKLAPRPRSAFMLLVPVEESIRRSREKNEPFPAPPEELERRLALYRQAADSWPGTVIDGMEPVDVVAGRIRRVIAHATARADDPAGP